MFLSPHSYWRKLNITKRECNGMYSLAAAMLAARRILDVPAINAYGMCPMSRDVSQKLYGKKPPYII